MEDKEDKEVTSLDEITETKIDYVTIVLDDRSKIEVIKKKLDVCLVLKQMMDVYKQADIVPIHNTDRVTFNYVLEFLNKKNGIDNIKFIRPLKSLKLKDHIIDIDKNWLVNWIENIYKDEGLEQIFKLINVSNAFNIQGLLNICCLRLSIDIAKDPSRTDIFKE